MKYIKATPKDSKQITMLVQNTIKTVYPKYYPKEVVDFFCNLHNQENILKDINSGLVSVLIKDDEIIGTGCYKDNHITRVYVSSQHQRKGYGSYIMQCLEDEIALKYDKSILDASLPASILYEKRGYRTKKHEKWIAENGAVLVYEIMEKDLEVFDNNPSV